MTSRTVTEDCNPLLTPVTLEYIVCLIGCYNSLRKQQICYGCEDQGNRWLKLSYSPWCYYLDKVGLTDEELSSPAATIRVLRSSGQVNSLDLLRSFCVVPPTHWLMAWQVQRLASAKKQNKETKKKNAEEWMSMFLTTRAQTVHSRQATTV